jgi:drug/metabolite transporter (DMT)-like permease
MRDRNLWIGLLAGMSTGVFWGIPFLAPQILPGYSAIELAFGRFFFFGVISFLFIKPVWSILSRMSWINLGKLFLLCASGFWFYSIVLFSGVQATDGIISSLMLGLLPITIPLFTRGRKHSGISFFFGLSVLLLGLLNLVFYPVLIGEKSVHSPSLGGAILLLFALALWTGFAIKNTRFLQRNTWIPRKDFASVMGVVSIISILPFFLAKVDVVEFVHRDRFGIYLTISTALGFGSSWLANWLWNICSSNCPPEISGPLIVFETIFGLLYTFAYESRMPLGYEVASIALFLVGVLLTVRSQMQK